MYKASKEKNFEFLYELKFGNIEYSYALNKLTALIKITFELSNNINYDQFEMGTLLFVKILK